LYEEEEERRPIPLVDSLTSLTALPSLKPSLTPEGVIGVSSYNHENVFFFEFAYLCKYTGPVVEGFVIWDSAREILAGKSRLRPLLPSPSSSSLLPPPSSLLPPPSSLLPPPSSLLPPPSSLLLPPSFLLPPPSLTPSDLPLFSILSQVQTALTTSSFYPCLKIAEENKTWRKIERDVDLVAFVIDVDEKGDVLMVQVREEEEGGEREWVMKGGDGGTWRIIKRYAGLGGICS
jgi:hypothetical protein